MSKGAAIHQILRLLTHMQGELAGDLSLVSLAAVARRSPSDLHRTFKRVTGETTAKYVERVRIELAAASLLTTQATVLDIALAHGFQSHEVFTRAFRRRFDEAPSAFRRRLASVDLDDGYRALVAQLSPCLALYRLPLRPSAKESPMSLTIKLETLTPQPALVVERTVTPDEVPAALGDILPRCFTYAMKQGVEMSGPPLCRYTKMSMGSMTLQAGVPIVGSATPEGDIQAIELPGGEAATAIHVGPYDTLRQSYETIEAWAREQGREVIDCWESYLTDPADVPDPAQWQTLLVMRLS